MFLNSFLAFHNADLPCPDLIRKKVGNTSKIINEVIRIRFIVRELTPNCEDANAKIIGLKSNPL